MSYYLAPSLVALRDEVNERFPNRDKSSDGWIGDPSHQARPSDHNPDYAEGGVVRAIDLDVDDRDPSRDLRRQILDATLGDPRVYYVISNGVIYSRTYDFEARRYTGSNGHYGHVHVSIRDDDNAERDTRRWLDPELRPPKTVSARVSLERVRQQFLIAAGAQKGKVEATPGVRRIQRALAYKYDLDLDFDGYVGESTLDAWGLHEKRRDGQGRPRVPDEQSLNSLSRGWFRVIA